MPSFAKIAALVRTPAAWGALSQGVVATAEHGAALGRFDFRTVIDVGANKGQFAAFAAARWPAAALYCFEPLPGPRARLEAVMRDRARIFDCALGARTDEVDILLSSREDSSSILPMAEQGALFGQTADGALRVHLRRLDDCIDANAIVRPALLKIDVQGFEREVLAGAGAVAVAVDAVFVELSFVELYRRQPLAGEVGALLAQMGFGLAGVFNQARDRKMRPLQADFLFERLERPYAGNAKSAETGPPRTS